MSGKQGFLKPATGPASATHTPSVTPSGLLPHQRSLRPTTTGQAPLQLNHSAPVTLMRNSLEGAAQKGNVRVGPGAGRGVKGDLRLQVRFENSFGFPRSESPAPSLLHNDRLLLKQEDAKVGGPLLEALRNCESALSDTFETERFFAGAKDTHTHTHNLFLQSHDLVLEGDDERHLTQNNAATCVQQHSKPSLQTEGTYVGQARTPLPPS